MDIKIQIRTRRTQRHGVAHDLDYRWQGKRYRPLLGYNLSPKEAERRAFDLIKRIQRGESGATREAVMATFTFRDALPLFWNSFEARGRIDQVRPRGIIDHYLLPFFGDRPLTSITAEDGLNYVVARLKEKATAGTIRREFQVLHRILNLCVAYEKLDRNRLKAVELPDADKRTRVAEHDELTALKKKADPELWRIILLALTTGLRSSRILSIDRNWIRRHEDGLWLHLPPPKSRIKGHPASIPLNSIAVAALNVDVQALADGRVFRRWKHIRSFRKLWEATCRRAKVVDLHFHDLRHTFTTWLQRLDVSYEIRQALLGHKMPGLTAEYSHGGKEWQQKLRQAVTKLAASPFLANDLVDSLVYERPIKTVGLSKSLKNGEPRAARTLDPRLKRAMLYQLS
ncbi:MAG: hypothetical protein NPIRA02_00420 [Nitrospirales bacterium]|nr:MAG: hypothetical protein NPIRA02_00420 [Nitrospirales bacterium]